MSKIDKKEFWLQYKDKIFNPTTLLNNKIHFWTDIKYSLSIPVDDDLFICFNSDEKLEDLISFDDFMKDDIIIDEIFIQYEE